MNERKLAGLGAGTRRGWVLAALAFSLGGCEETTAPPTSLTERTSGQMAAGATTHVRAGNPIGPILVEGESLGPPLVRWVLDKEVTAPTPDDAHRALTEIVFDGAVAGDSIIARVAPPPLSTTVIYESSLSLGIPFGSRCSIDEAVGDVTVRYLVADLEIASGGPVTVVNHVGSCRVAGSGGDVSLRVSLPTSGSCTATTPSGGIVVEVPAATSAQVSLVAGGGTITVEGLSLTGVTQTPHTLTGTLGAGEGEIRLETSAGNVVLRALEGASVRARSFPADRST